MSVRVIPRFKRGSVRKEAVFFVKNILGEDSCDAYCPEIANACNAMEIAEELSQAGWKVKVAPFEDYPMLHIRAKTKGVRK